MVDEPKAPRLENWMGKDSEPARLARECDDLRAELLCVIYIIPDASRGALRYRGEANISEMAGADLATYQRHPDIAALVEAWDIDPVDAYSESGLCERTCAVLAKVKDGHNEIRA